MDEWVRGGHAQAVVPGAPGSTLQTGRSSKGGSSTKNITDVELFRSGATEL